MLKKFIIFITFISSLNTYSQECELCNLKDELLNYAKDIVNEYKEASCSPSLIPFELETVFSHQQRCQLISDLRILRKISLSKFGDKYIEVFNPSLSSEYAGEDLYNWLIERVKRIYFIDSRISTAINYGLCEDTGVCSSSYQRGDVGLDNSYFDKATPLERIKILIHEARHTDGQDSRNGKFVSGLYSDTLHINCNRSNISTTGSIDSYVGKTCDDNLDGSIGASLIFLGNLILNCDQCENLIDLGSEDLNQFFLRNLYNTELSSINNLNFDISKTLE